MTNGPNVGPVNERTGGISKNGPADATDAELQNGEVFTTSSDEEHKPESIESAGNEGWQEPGRDLNDSLHAGRAAHAATEAAIVNAAGTSTDSQMAASKAAPLPEHRSALRSGRAVEASLVRGAERPAHARMGGETAGERGISNIGAQEAAGPALARDPAGTAEANGRREGSVERAAANEPNGLSGEETFARLDAEGASRSIHWVQAGAHRAEAGYLDPALGWVAVRAETNGGGVHAAVLPGSPEAAQVLGTHLSGLNAFLAQQHGPHATATMAAPGDGRFEAGAEQGNGAGAGSGRDDERRNMAAPGRVGDLSPQTAASAGRAMDRSIGSEGSAISRAGTYVSVMA
jgi:hypothetical protein